MKKSKFIVLAGPRTGSSDFVNRLNRYQNITCLGELFHKSGTYFQTLGLGDITIEERDSDHEAFLKKIESFYKTDHLGFKLFPAHKVKRSLFLKDKSFSLICLTRSNILAQYASTRTAQISKKWHYLIDEKINSTSKPIFDSQDFINYSNKQSKIKDIAFQAQKKKRDVIFINYEKLNEEKTYLDVLNFLKYTGPDINTFHNSGYQKSASGSVIERFSNPMVVLKYLKNNDLMHWKNE